MDFSWTADQLALRAKAAEVAADAVARFGRSNDSWINGYSKEFSKELAAHGWIGMTWPDNPYSGTASPAIDRLIVGEELIAAGAPIAASWFADRQMGPALLAYGTSDQQAAFLPGIVAGETTWCIGMSEPEAGSDLASLRTSAQRDGDSFVINGQKIWTSTARQADMIFCLVRTESEAPKHAGISYLIFPMDLPGIEVRPLKTMTGHAEFNETFFTDVRVPVDQIVGLRGQGWFVANATLGHERGMLGDPDALENRLLALIRLMQEEQVGSARAIDNPVLRDRLIALQAEVAAMKYNGMRVLSDQLKGEPGGMAKLIVKLQSCELAHQISALAIDAMGEMGILYADSPRQREGSTWQWNYMFQLGLIIGGGTAQIQKNIIAERGLNMPREPRLAQEASSGRKEVA